MKPLGSLDDKDLSLCCVYAIRLPKGADSCSSRTEGDAGRNEGELAPSEVPNATGEAGKLPSVFPPGDEPVGLLLRDLVYLIQAIESEAVRNFVRAMYRLPSLYSPWVPNLSP